MKKALIFLVLILLIGMSGCGTVVEETPETTTTVIVESRPYWSRYYYYDWETGRYLYGRRYHVRPPIYYHHPTPPPPPKKPHGGDVRPPKPGGHNPGGVRPGGNRNPNPGVRPNNTSGRGNHGTPRGSSRGGGRRR